MHCGLLQNSSPLVPEVVARILGLVRGQPVRSWDRPVRHAVSPRILTGVDCRPPSALGPRRRLRLVGTVASEARVTVGQILQGCATTTIRPAALPRRLSWSHYLTRPGVVEMIGPLAPDDLVSGFLSGLDPEGALELAEICSAVMLPVQLAEVLDRKPRLRVARTRLRWAAVAGPDDRDPTVQLRIGPEALRTLEIHAPAGMFAVLPDLCQDVALHDWLLSAVVEAVDVANIGVRDRAEVVRRLRPAVDGLLHAWMPSARLPLDAVPYWAEIDRVAGFSRQWETLVHRIRDQLVMAVLDD